MSEAEAETSDESATMSSAVPAAPEPRRFRRAAQGFPPGFGRCGAGRAAAGLAL